MGLENQSSNKKSLVVTKPRQCASVDQMDYNIPGFILQMKGKITGCRYLYATVFIDYFSDNTSMRLQKTLTLADTIRAKKAFEATCNFFM